MMRKRRGVRSMTKKAQNRLKSLLALWLDYFSGCEPGQETCGDCEAHKVGLCPGEGLSGEECVRCIETREAVAFR